LEKEGLRKTRELRVYIKKITFGKDGFIYVTICHPMARNEPTLQFNSLKQILELIEDLHPINEVEE